MAIAFTERGCALALRVAQALREGGVVLAASVSGPARMAHACGISAYESLEAWTAQAFAQADALLYVGATGIAVRAIAPHVADKFRDPAVVCVDEAGSFAVPLLSGHVGGANDLARAVAGVTGGQAVVSTATDVNGLFAVDEWARKQGLQICERAVAKEVAATLLAGGTVGFASDFPWTGALPKGVVAQDGGQPVRIPPVGFHVTLDAESAPFARTLHLVPRVATVGAGCHRDLPAEQLEACIAEALAAAHVSAQAVRTLASIDVKADEPCMHEVAAAHGWGTVFYTADELNAVPGNFTPSAFVRQTVGTDNVCERAAACGGNTLVFNKYPSSGATAAIAVAPFQTTFG